MSQEPGKLVCTYGPKGVEYIHSSMLDLMVKHGEAKKPEPSRLPRDK